MLFWELGIGDWGLGIGVLEALYIYVPNDSAIAQFLITNPQFPF